MIMQVQTELKQEWDTIKQANYSTVFAEKQQLEDSLSVCMDQYEERLRRATACMDELNQGYQQAQNEAKATKDKATAELKQRDDFLQQLIEHSSKLKAKVHRVFEGKVKNVDKVREALNEIELGVAQIYDLKADSDRMSGELRDHVMDLFNRTVIGLLKKHQ